MDSASWRMLAHIGRAGRLDFNHGRGWKSIGEQRELRLASSSVRLILNVAGYLSRKV